MNVQVQLARTPARLAGRAAALSLIAAVSACGSVAAPGAGQAAGTGHTATAGTTSPAPSGARGTPSGQAVTECATSELKVTLDTSAAGVAAGSSYVPLEFTNASGRACVLSGYPAVTFASSAAGPQLGTTAEAVAKTVPVLAFTLAPGASAHAWLQIADVASYPADKCKPERANGLRVGFSSLESAAFLPHSFQACARAIAGSAGLAVFPVQAGQARRGTAP